MTKEALSVQQSASAATEVKLPADVRIRAPGMRGAVKTVEQALNTIDRELSPELAQLHEIDHQMHLSLSQTQIRQYR